MHALFHLFQLNRDEPRTIFEVNELLHECLVLLAEGLLYVT